MSLLSLTLRASRFAWVPLACVAACSASYQSLYEGDVRFEHCYKLDEERTAPIADKQKCWQDWSRHYTYGQTRDRIEYALARTRALGERGGGAPQSAPPLKPAPPIACPMPTSAFAAPPQTLSPDAGVATDGGPPTSSTPGGFSDGGSGISTPVDRATLASAPGATCGGSCAKAWLACGEACKKPPCQTKCDETYRACMRSCF